MKTFKDSAGKTWTIQINVSSVKRCRAHPPNIDLPGCFDDEAKGIQDLTNDPVKFVELLYVLVMDEAKERQVSQEEFESSMYGEAIENAFTLFLEELIEFMPSEKKRVALRKVMAASRDLQDKLMVEATRQLDEVDTGEIVKLAMTSSGGARGSLDSILDRLRSANS